MVLLVLGMGMGMVMLEKGCDGGGVMWYWCIVDDVMQYGNVLLGM